MGVNIQYTANGHTFAISDDGVLMNVTDPEHPVQHVGHDAGIILIQLRDAVQRALTKASHVNFP